MWKNNLEKWKLYYVGIDLCNKHNIDISKFKNNNHLVKCVIIYILIDLNNID